MAGTKEEVNPALLENILRQPEALRSVAAYQLGPGRAALTRCAELLTRGKRVVLSGMGASLNACIPASYLLAERGAVVSVIEASELLYFVSGMLDAETTVVLVSRSGESVEVTKLLPKLKERGCRAIGISNVPGSTLERDATESIVVNSPPDQLVAIQTYTATLATLELLAAESCGELDRAEDELEKTIGITGSLLADSAASVHWDELMACEAPLYLLGRGPSLASVNAGLFLMHEVAKMAAVGISAAQFRHGPVEVVNENFRAIVFGSQAATAELDLSLAEDLIGMGGCIRWVGPMARRSNVASFWRWPNDIPHRFAQILEIIPLQLLSLRLAQARGVALGTFRFAPAVTLSETGFAV